MITATASWKTAFARFATHPRVLVCLTLVHLSPSYCPLSRSFWLACLGSVRPLRGPSEQSFATERDRKCAGIRPGVYGYHPAQIPGPHQGSDDGEGGPKTQTPNQRFCLGVISESCGLRGTGDIPAIRRDQFQHRRLFTTGDPSRHSAGFHFEDSKCRLEFMYGLCMACPISGCSPILCCRAFSKSLAPATMLCCLS
jgi:hypothetical protein